MKAADLHREAERAVIELIPHLSRLPALGCPLSAIARLGQFQPPVGMVRALWGRGGLWQPDEAGERMLVVPVTVAGGFERWGEWIETRDIIDLIVFRSRQPQRWAWRTGTAWALGEKLLEDRGEPVPIVSTPLGWLAAAGEAVCILDWSASSPAWAALRHGPNLICDSDHLRQRLHRAMMASVRLPEMTVQSVEADRAA